MSRAEQHHRIDYLEFAVRSIPASRQFFGDAFGWTFNDYGPDYCEFRDGRLTGGFFHGEPSPGGALVVIYSRSLEQTQAAIEASGGRMTRSIFVFPGGRRFHFVDPDGYAWAVWTEA
ncbi:VOC family protein [Dyella sp.]|uniref:VOC family protein n=1 Tax=Dyella sp. TaxID=1869338 RepID=UPI002ED22084